MNNIAVDSDCRAYGQRKTRNIEREIKLQKKIRRLNRKLARQQGKAEQINGAIKLGENGKCIRRQPSKAWLRTSEELARANNKLSNIRNDIRHQVTASLIKRNVSQYNIEDIDAKQMQYKSPTGTPHEKRMRKINREISFGELRRQLEYKAKWNGATVKVEAPHYTSKQCPNCNEIKFSHRDTYFKCQKCGFGIKFGTEIPQGGNLPRNHRDVVGATNLQNPDNGREIRVSAYAERHPKKIPSDSGVKGSGKTRKQKASGSSKKP